MNRVLILASVASMIDQFNIPNIELLLDMGFQVHVACNFKEGNTCSKEKIDKLIDKLKIKNVKCYQIDFARDIKQLGKNVNALWQVERLLEKNDYSFIHCHSPIGGVVGRIAGKKYNRKVIYTAHGFHFYKGAPLINWLIYYPIEKTLSKYTDVLITINKDDYSFAKKKMNSKKIVYLPGIGIDLEKFKFDNFNRNEYRLKMGLEEDDFAILSVGELNKNKNHEQVIRAIAKLNNRHIHYFIAGQGDLRDYLYDLADKLDVKNQVHLLGFRKDIKELNHSSDLFVLPSIREGLNVSLMEAMACGLPCIANKIRGNVDLIDNGKGGYLCNPESEFELQNQISLLIDKQSNKMKRYNKNKILQFSLESILSKLSDIYKNMN